MQKKDIVPQTGTRENSGLVSLLKGLQKSVPTEGVPQLPEPIFDPYMGKDFKNRKKRNPFDSGT